ncbi:MAG: 50S ribosomal protein L29 [Chloroflexi bacterium]|jgi:large subunit ribosomal protein L29|nr:50S ribosomal protein L29 [Chloroflexota bacterium]MBT3669350.1 50S ribosomal protein L29 [Chloroflexota bacterium]MBT4003451.1 50S ribosomal protein L29 [Chloroflexota bacterium]MBT4306057.1 50S ribosomal protein L29 [Chloroflexota bacterium]MBT4532701.1 50S ribosomal protein L29 [Chloroflexota bacterium]
MKAAEIREMTIEEIEAELDASREELMRLRFQFTTGELSDHTRFSIARRKIARMLTILSELKQSEENEGDA